MSSSAPLSPYSRQLKSGSCPRTHRGLPRAAEALRPARRCAGGRVTVAAEYRRLEGWKVMKRVTREDVTKAVGRVDDVTIAEIIGTGATADELAEARAWLVNDEPLLNAGKPLATGRVRELIDILAELEPSEDDDKDTGPVVSQD